jgi:molecular chaperone GrpE (heat shock protein)
MVIGLVGYVASLPTTQTKTTNICSECEFTELQLTNHETRSVKLVKLQNCLTSKKKAIELTEAEKAKRLAKRSADDSDEQAVDTTTSLDKIFKVSDSFKRLLKQYTNLKNTVSKQMKNIKKGIDQTLTEFGNEDFQAESESMTIQPKKARSCADRIKCDNPNTVIKVQQAVLTNKNNDQVCGSLQHVLPLNLADMNEECYNKDQATERTKMMCDGETECKVSISLFYNTLCDCTEKKHLEVEYTCEPATEVTKHSRAKRSMYYGNNAASQRQLENYREGIMSYYDYMGNNIDYYYDGDYYGCAYDYYSYYYGVLNGCDYYDDYYNYYYDPAYYYDYAYLTKLSGHKSKKTAPNKDLVAPQPPTKRKRRSSKMNVH